MIRTMIRRLGPLLAMIAAILGGAMARAAEPAQDYLLMVFSEPVAGQEAAFNSWYDREHLPAVVSLPGMVDGRRYELADRQMRPGSTNFGRYLALYRIHTADLAGVFKEMQRRIAAHETTMDPSLDPKTLHAFTYRAIRAPYEKAGEANRTPTYVHLVFTEGKDGMEDEYNRWYDSTHVPDIVSVPGFIRGQRFVASDVQMAAPGPTKYLVRFDVATDDWNKTLDTFGTMAPKMKISPAFNGDKTNGFSYRAIGPVVTHQTATRR